MKEKCFSNFNFGGISIRATDHAYIVHHVAYAKKFKKLSADSSFQDFRALRHKLAWLSISRPDISTAANIIFQVKNDTFEKKNAKQMNKTRRKTLLTTNRALRFHKLDKETLRKIVVSDAPFASNQDLP